MMAELLKVNTMTERNSITCKVVEQIAERKGVSPVELDPLRTVDPESLNRLFQTEGSNERTVGKVTFTYCGYEVTVLANDEINVAPISERSEQVASPE